MSHLREQWRRAASTDPSDPFYSRVEEIQAAGVKEGAPLYRGVSAARLPVEPKQHEHGYWGFFGITDADVAEIGKAVAGSNSRAGNHWSTRFDTAAMFARVGNGHPVVMETSGWSWVDVDDSASYSGGYSDFAHEHEVPFKEYTDIPITAIWLQDRIGHTGPYTRYPVRLWTMAGSSWRAMGNELPWLEHEALILTDGGPSGRKSYEVYDHGELVGTRPTLADAKAIINQRWGRDASWRLTKIDRIAPPVHYYFGPMADLQSPTSVWIGS